MLTDKHGREIKAGDRVLVEITVERLDVDAGGVVRIGEFGWHCRKLPSQVEVIARDDDEPITEEWLLSTGWHDAPPYFRRAGCYLAWERQEGMLYLDDGRGCIPLLRPRTRGQLRRLVAALKGE